MTIITGAKGEVLISNIPTDRFHNHYKKINYGRIFYPTENWNL